MRRGAPLVLALALGCCAPAGPSRVAPHYVVGPPYQVEGVWRYPREQFDYDETGVATVTARQSGLTADGEAADPQAMAAAHPTLQLPAVAQVTDLDSGYQVLVRVNDRGPMQPGRIIALTPRAMQLLHAASPTPRVRVRVLEAESLRLASDLDGPDAPRLAMVAAPRTDVAQEMLPAPGGASAAPRPHGSAAARSPAPADLPTVPLRLPETATRVPPRPGALYVEAAAFAQLEYARMMQARLAPLRAEVWSSYTAPRERAYRVRIGPLPGVAAADAVLARAVRAGAPDARIVAE